MYHIELLSLCRSNKIRLMLTIKNYPYLLMSLKRHIVMTKTIKWIIGGGFLIAQTHLLKFFIVMLVLLGMINK